MYKMMDFYIFTCGLESFIFLKYLRQFCDFMSFWKKKREYFEIFDQRFGKSGKEGFKDDNLVLFG